MKGDEDCNVKWCSKRQANYFCYILLFCFCFWITVRKSAKYFLRQGKSRRCFLLRFIWSKNFACELAFYECACMFIITWQRQTYHVIAAAASYWPNGVCKCWSLIGPCYLSGAPNDGFLPNALKRCFRLSGVLLKLCRLILGCAIKFLSVRFF